MFLVELKDLVKSYGEVKALKYLNLKIPKGSLFGLLGPNGAGKSTTLKIICTLLSQDSGHVKVADYDPLVSPRETRKQIGYVAQEVSIDKILTGRELLQLQGDLYHLDNRIKNERIEELIIRLGMEDWIDRRCGSYSGGMRRRIDLASGLLHQPQLLVLDEPTVGLDIESRNVIWEILRDLNDKGTTILLSSHYLEEVDALSDQIAIIDNGQVIAEGSPDELKHKLGGDRVTLRVQEFSNEQEADKICYLLKEIKGVSDVVVNRSQGFSLNFVIENQTLLPILSDQLNKAGFELFALSHSRPTLDDVYLQATGRTLIDAELSLAGKRDLKLENKKAMR